MEPFWSDNLRTVYNKSCTDMSELPDESVQCVVTSPPYWGLRRYSGDQDLIWGGNSDCQHKWVTFPKVKRCHLRDRSTLVGSQTATLSKEAVPSGNRCSICGAVKCAFGLEESPELYVQKTIEILREIRRVLRKDGVVFWNCGDSYSQGSNSAATFRRDRAAVNAVHSIPFGMKPKDLCLIPFRVAIAAQEDGWWVRSVIIWSKNNPMPESVKDRPTESHEYILMLTKSAKYYWDQEAVREPQTEGTLARFGKNPRISAKKKWVGMEGESNTAIQQHIEDRDGFMSGILPNGRNLRSVWRFPTTPFPGSHFAVFPPKLPEICIKAATPEVGCCAKCGKPWVRVLEKKGSQFNIRVRDAAAGRGTPEEGYKATDEEIKNYPGNHPDPGYRKTIDWRPTCKCNVDKVPSIVLDPFAGSGTTLEVAAKLGQRSIGYEISTDYCRLIVERNRQAALSPA